VQLTVGDLSQAVGSTIRWADMPPLEGPLAPIGRVVIDSRQVQRGDVFWALRGQRCHGADYAHEALVRGALGVVADRAVTPLPGTFSIEVPDGQLALWEFARWYRQLLTAPVVAVTGSVGKTTTRQMIYAVLSADRRGTASAHNYNNQIGVPLSILSAHQDDEFVILEIGASAAGEVDALARLAEPDIGVITCIADAHLGSFGGYEQVLAAKAELLGVLGSHGSAVLPGDEPRLQQIANDCQAGTIRFGCDESDDVTAMHVHSSEGSLTFQIGEQPFRIPVWGQHHLGSALAAIAVGKLFDCSLSEIAAALSGFKSVPMRCEVLQFGAITAINDTYNACPISMKAALALLSEFGNSSRRIVACGDMVELGEASERLHYQLGQQVVTVGQAQQLFVCGNHADTVASGAQDAGMPKEQVTVSADADQTAHRLKIALQPGDVVLAKGSRIMQMERVIESVAEHSIARVA